MILCKLVVNFVFVDDVKLNCNFEWFEKCFFDNVKEGVDFEWGLGFVSIRIKRVFFFYIWYFF